MRRLVISLLYCCLAAVVVAGPIDREKASAVARQFMNRHGVTTGRLQVSSLSMPGSSDRGRENAAVPCYIVNNCGDGYVVVAGDDMAYGVLAYSTQGSLAADGLPEGLEAWLTDYSRQIEAARTGNVRHVNSLVQGEPVAPFLLSTWNQGSPYNNLCPEVSGQKPWTGCVATAMSQVMYYYQWPKESIPAVPSYKVSGVTYDELPATIFDFDHMAPDYTGVTDADSIEAVARLMLYAGYSVEMKYGTGGSSAHIYKCPDAFRDIFGYDEGVQTIQRSSLPLEQWEQIIYDEVSHGRPVIFSASSAMGHTHAFICDGYDGNGFYHINWGYGGTADGWYRLHALNIQALRTDGGDDLGAYSFSSRIVIGIQPPVGETVEVLDPYSDKLFCDSLSMTTDNTTVGYSYESGLSQISLRYLLVNKGEKQRRFQYAIGIYKDNDRILEKTINGRDFAPTGQLLSSASLQSWASGLDDGTYRIVMISRISGSGKPYSDCYDSENHYVEMTISEGTASFNPVNNHPAVPEMAVVTTNASPAFEGEVTRITVSFTNNDGFEYRGPLYLIVDGTAVACEGAYIAPTETDSLDFYFRPTAVGDLPVVVSTDKYGSNRVGESSIYVNARSLSATAAFEYADTDTRRLIGLPLLGTATLANNGTVPFRGVCNVRLLSSVDTVTVYNGMVDVEAGAAQDFDINYDGLTYGEDYSLLVTYIDGKEASRTEAFTLVPAALCWTDDNTKVRMAPGILPDDALAVDLTSVPGHEGEFYPNSNPNTMFYLSEDSPVPESLAASNCVVGTVAPNISLTGGHDLFIPIDFTAQEVAYSYIPVIGTDGTGNGWSTIVLPYAVEHVYNATDEVEIDWFHNSEDSLKDFWLKEFCESNSDYVAFEHVAQWQANTPYIIAVPEGETWGSSFDLRNKNLLFKAQNVVLSTHTSPVVTHNGFDFIGTYTACSLDNEYILNDEGSAFERGAGSVGSFHAWFHALKGGKTIPDRLMIIRPEQAGMALLTDSSARVTVYSVDGVKVAEVPAVNGMPDLSSLPDGIYISNNRKFIISRGR